MITEVFLLCLQQLRWNRIAAAVWPAVSPVPSPQSPWKRMNAVSFTLKLIRNYVFTVICVPKSVPFRTHIQVLMQFRISMRSRISCGFPHFKICAKWSITYISDDLWWPGKRPYSAAYRHSLPDCRCFPFSGNKTRRYYQPLHLWQYLSRSSKPWCMEGLSGNFEVQLYGHWRTDYFHQHEKQTCLLEKTGDGHFCFQGKSAACTWRIFL